MRKFLPCNTSKQFFEVISLQSLIQKSESFTPANKLSQIQLPIAIYQQKASNKKTILFLFTKNTPATPHPYFPTPQASKIWD